MKKLWKRPKKNRAAPPEGHHRYSLAQMKKIFTYIQDIPSANALRHKDAVEGATLLTEALGLPSHYDPQKNWDTLKCLFHITDHCGLDDPILDGGSSYATILNWLALLGYQKLYACDLVDRADQFTHSRIQFSVQDLTTTTFPDEYFKAITSISVIEHGVDLHAFLKEMARILKPGGRLLISTDFWSEAIDCRGIYPYGEDAPEMKIFQPRELMELCSMAQSIGFELTAALDLQTEERAIYWERVDRAFTFAFMAFIKQARPTDSPTSP